MQIKIKKYHEMDGRPVLGLVDIEIDCNGYPLTISGIRHLNGGLGEFFAFPSRKGKDKEGNNKYFNICGFYSKESHAVFQEKMKKAYGRYSSSAKSTSNHYSSAPAGNNYDYDFPF